MLNSANSGGFRVVFTAGFDLKFEVEILAVREATKKELEHGHVHSKV